MRMNPLPPSPIGSNNKRREYWHGRSSLEKKFVKTSLKVQFKNSLKVQLKTRLKRFNYFLSEIGQASISNIKFALGIVQILVKVGTRQIISDEQKE